MLTAMALWAKTYARTHVLYLALIAVGLIAGRSWLVEHDNRLLAEQQGKITEVKLAASAEREKALGQQLVDIKAQAESDKKALLDKLAKVKTAEQAKPVIETLAPELHPVVVPNTQSVTVDAVPLAAVLTQCRVDQVDLGSSKQQLEIKDKVIAEKVVQLGAKDDEIKALKKPRGFWKRVWGGVKTFGVGVGVGAALGARL